MSFHDAKVSTWGEIHSRAVKQQLNKRTAAATMSQGQLALRLKKDVELALNSSNLGTWILWTTNEENNTPETQTHPSSYLFICSSLHWWYNLNVFFVFIKDKNRVSLQPNYWQHYTDSTFGQKAAQIPVLRPGFCICSPLQSSSCNFVIDRRCCSKVSL